MTVLDDLLEQIESSLDTNDVVRDLVIGCFFAAVTSRTVGLASVLRPPRSLHREDPLPRAGHLLPASVRDLAQMARSPLLLEASVGMAAINSVLGPPEQFIEKNAADLLVERSRNRRVLVVGGFPFAERLRSVAKALHVFELDPVPGSGERAARELFGELSGAEVVVLSATTLINHTFEEIHAHLPPGAFVVMVGPSTPLSPILFDWGIDVLAGSLVTDETLARQSLLQGATFRQMQGVEKLAMVKEDG